MNRVKALSIADRIMTRIETDKAIHKDAIADEIQAGDALDEIVDIISHDGEKWVHRDGTPFDTDADVKQKGVDAEIHALLLDAEKRAAKLHAVLTDFTFPRIEPDRLPPVPDIGTIRVQGGGVSMWDGEKWWVPPSCVAVSAHEPALGEPLFINGDLVLSNFDALDLDDKDTA